MPLLSVSAHDVDAAGLAVDAALPPAWLDAELGEASVKAPGPGRVSVRLSRSGNDVVVRGQVKAALTIPCARCLEPAIVHVDTELSLLLQPAPAAKPVHAGATGKHPKPAKEAKPAKEKEKEEEYEFTAAEADVDTYDGATVVLDDFVREAILLEVPNFPLCSEECPGIRPPAGSTSAEAPPLDPRLSPLGALKAKLAASVERTEPMGDTRPETTKKRKKE
jgi:uncharacterized protein